MDDNAIAVAGMFVEDANVIAYVRAAILADSAVAPVVTPLEIVMAHCSPAAIGAAVTRRRRLAEAVPEPDATI